MVFSYVMRPSGPDSDSLLADLEALLEQEEVALVELEHRVSEKRLALFAPEPRELLDVLQSVEAVVGRIGRLESARAHLGGAGNYSHGRSPGAVVAASAEENNSAASARLLALRRRILRLIARIAEYDEANSHLIAGLARAGRARLNMLSRLDGAEASDTSHAHRVGGAERIPASLNFQA